MTADQNKMVDQIDQADHCYRYSPRIEGYIESLVQLAFGSEPQSGKVSKKNQVGSPSPSYKNQRMSHELDQDNLEQVELVLG